MKTTRNRFFVFSIITISLFLTACRDRPQSSRYDLRMALGSEPPTLDPQIADTGVSVFILRQIVSTLFRYDAEQNIIPMDARSYEWRNRGRVLRVVLRESLKWSDGMPLQACQYRDGILRALDPAVPSALAEILFEIEGARARKAGGLESGVKITCNNAEAWLEFQALRAESPKLLHALAFVVAAPLRKDLLAIRQGDWLLPNGSTPGVASGAFVLTEWSHNKRIRLEARALREKDLPGDRVAKLQHVHLPVVKDPTTALSMYESGELDFIDEIPSVLVSKLKTRTDHRVGPYFTTYMVGFSLMANPVLKSPLVRQALARVAHQEEVPQMLGGDEAPARGWIPPGLLVSDARPTATLFDPAAGRRLLAEAGYAEGKNFPELQLYYNAGERHQLLMERLAHNFRTHLNIAVRLEPLEWKVLVAQLKQKAPDLYRYAWSAVYPDPIFFLELYLSDGLNNFGRWHNAEFDRIVRQLAEWPTPRRDAKFWAQVRRAQEILVREDPALIPLYHYVRHVLVKTNVRGLELPGAGAIWLQGISKVDDAAPLEK